MEREIKFRAWDKMQKEMSIKDFTISDFVEFFDRDSCWDIDNEARLVLMQFTGLKDKNGKEIYEGDVMEWEDYEKDDSDILKNRWHKLIERDKDERNKEWGTYKVRDVVEINPPTLWLKEENFGYEGENLIQPEYCEVIGNIYESKHLLDNTDTKV